MPDVSGLWSTAHDFDVGQSLRGEPGRGLSGLKSLPDDLILKLERRPGLRDLRPVLVPMIAEATSPWVQTIIRIGDDIGAILGNLRSEGAMSLSTGQDPSLVTGTEQWESSSLPGCRCAATTSRATRFRPTAHASTS